MKKVESAQLALEAEEKMILETTSNDDDTGLTKKKMAVFECPHCKQPIRVRVNTTILGLEVPVPDEEVMAERTRKSMLTREQKEVIELAKEVGIFYDFEQVVREVHFTHVPKDMEHYFIHFLKTARPVLIPSFVLKRLSQECGGERINFYSAQGVGAVVTKGIIRSFIPEVAVRGRMISTPSGKKLSVRANVDEEEFSEWIRTRFGFAGGMGEFLFTLNSKKAVGEFDQHITNPG